MSLPRTSLTIVEVQIAFMAMDDMVTMLDRRCVRDADIEGMGQLRVDATKLRDRLAARLAAFKASVATEGGRP